ncbi:HxsD-like protein [Candidatus Woesearchaeota archaeon]|nr:HxsD-like protein [Candidatus Woesearchaeota archaeon]
MSSNEIIFSLNTGFYSKDSIKETIDAFSQFGKFTMTETQDRIMIRFEPCEGLDEGTIMKVENEFRNHALASGS